MGLACRAWVQQGSSREAGPRQTASGASPPVFSAGLRRGVAASRKWTTGDSREEIGGSCGGHGGGRRKKRSERPNCIFPCFDAKHGAGAPDRLGAKVLWQSRSHAVRGQQGPLPATPTCIRRGSATNRIHRNRGHGAAGCHYTALHRAEYQPPQPQPRIPFPEPGAGTYMLILSSFTLSFFSRTPARPATLL